MNIYLDIETIPTQNPNHQAFVTENLKAPANYKKQETIDEWLAENKQIAIDKTALDGAFGEIVAIGVAIDDQPVRVFYHTDWQQPDREYLILTDFFHYLKKQCENVRTIPLFIGHNIAKFDYQFILQRAIINRVQPYLTATKRNTYDTMTEWAGYGNKDYPSLNKLCQVLEIEQKGDIDGSKVWEYVQTGRIDEVADYCAKDVERVRQVYKRMNFME